MNEGAVARRQTRFGHLLAVFGLFLMMSVGVLQSTAHTRTVAFGTAEIAGLSNQYRTNAGLNPLSTNQTLTASAQAKADHMAANSYFAHDAPDGTSPWFFFSQAGYSYISAGENLALSNQSASSVVNGWFNSEGHRANMLSSVFSEVGYGIAFSSSFVYKNETYSDVYLVAAHYGQPIGYTQNTTAPPDTHPASTVPIEDHTQANSDSGLAQQPIDTTPQEETGLNPDSLETQASVDQEEQTSAADDPFKSDTSASGLLADVDSSLPPNVPRIMAYAGLGVGLLLVVAGVIVEVIRLRHHYPLIPRTHHQ